MLGVSSLLIIIFQEKSLAESSAVFFVSAQTSLEEYGRLQPRSQSLSSSRSQELSGAGSSLDLNVLLSIITWFWKNCLDEAEPTVFFLQN